MRKFKVYLNSGANVNGPCEFEVTLDELGMSSEEWDALSLVERCEIMSEIAFQRIVWDFYEIE